jgi:hypothetical protein
VDVFRSTSVATGDGPYFVGQRAVTSSRDAAANPTLPSESLDDIFRGLRQRFGGRTPLFVALFEIASTCHGYPAFTSDRSGRQTPGAAGKRSQARHRHGLVSGRAIEAPSATRLVTSVQGDGGGRVLPWCRISDVERSSGALAKKPRAVGALACVVIAISDVAFGVRLKRCRPATRTPLGPTPAHEAVPTPYSPELSSSPT